MPFWWARRRKRWYGRRYKRRYPTTRQRRRRRTWHRRRYRRPYRRRRRRRKKVKKKKPTLILRQWQPDSIKLCKIKGFDSLIWGSQGTQGMCSTMQMYEYTRYKYPGGGSFCAQIYTLQYLYDQYRLRNNIWTATNQWKDLCRYLKCYFTFYRHQIVDFVICYYRQPPFDITVDTYMNFHPYMLLQQKHKIILPSKNTNPRSKSKKTKLIKPPKQMLSKWFFQKQFTNYDLVMIAASACSLSYPRISCCNENRMITLTCLNAKFFQDSNWGHTLSGDSYFKPYALIAHDLVYYSGNQQKPTTYNPIKDYIEPRPTIETESGRYYRSISWEGGFFSPRVLSAWDIKKGTQKIRPLPIVLARYNPAIDDGKNNKIWLTSIFGGHYDLPSKTPDFIIEGKPLWLAFWGYYDYLKQSKGEGIFPVHMFVVKSPYIQTSQTETTTDYYAFIDRDILQGKLPYDTPLTKSEKTLWYPTVEWQLKTISAICQSGPYVPKLDNQTQSTWELPVHYSFHFKWGGPHITDRPVDDPSKKNQYPVPDTIKEAIQICDPSKNIAATMFHDWDYRRGCLTSTAIKRMQQNLQTDSSLESDADSEPTKKKRRLLPVLHDPEKKAEKIHKCLLSLCEENTCQEIQEEENLLNLIKQQQQQQNQLKQQLLTLIKDLKQKQKHLQLQTGMLE
nr:MAG: ORF1 [Torque teno midi virus]